jgi:hypothetical protein
MKRFWTSKKLQLNFDHRANINKNILCLYAIIILNEK